MFRLAAEAGAAGASRSLPDTMKTVRHAKTAFLFPGTSLGYLAEAKSMRSVPYGQLFLENAGRALRRVLSGRTLAAARQITDNVFIYAVSCAFCERLRRQGIRPDITSGYSLGLHAMLYCGGLYSYETGLDIVVDCQVCVTEAYEAAGLAYGMGAIIGLTRPELEQRVFPVSGPLEIAVVNGERNYVLTGPYDRLQLALQAAEREGAFRAVVLLRHFGFHTSFLEPHARRIAQRWVRYPFTKPTCPTLSPLDGSEIQKGDVVDVLARNLHSPIDWAGVFVKLASTYGVREAYEAGPGDSLAKIGRYLSHEIRFAPVHLGTPEEVPPA
jgi:malonyl CoA-acyl carrier protein transacylase